MPVGSERLSLKWGTLKEWSFTPGSPAHDAFDRYCEIGIAAGAMQQKDTPEQKELILEMIDKLDAETVFLDWDGVEVSKDQAKQYVTGYGKKAEPAQQ